METLELMELHNDCMTYGFTIKQTDIDSNEGLHTIRIIKLANRYYYDHMCRGEVLECELIGEEDEQE